MKTKVVPIKEFKNKANQLLRERRESIVTKRGIPIARVESLDERKDAIEILKEVKKEI